MSDGLSTEGLYPKGKRADATIRRLALAILVQALRDVIAKPKKKGETGLWRRDAALWFADQTCYAGGFEWVCEILEREPGELRSWVREYMAARQGKRKELAEGLIHQLRFVR